MARTFTGPTVTRFRVRPTRGCTLSGRYPVPSGRALKAGRPAECAAWGLLARDASWPVAAERPTHLAAIVPWEGASDAYREFNDAWYRVRTPDLEQIQIPVLAVGSWGSLHLHQRGILNGFCRAGSSVRQLVISSGTHIGGDRRNSPVCFDFEVWGACRRSVKQRAGSARADSGQGWG